MIWDLNGAVWKWDSLATRLASRLLFYDDVYDMDSKC